MVICEPAGVDSTPYMNPYRVPYDQACVAWWLAWVSLRKHLTGVLYCWPIKLYRNGKPCNHS